MFNVILGRMVFDVVKALTDFKLLKRKKQQYEFWESDKKCFLYQI